MTSVCLRLAASSTEAIRSWSHTTERAQARKGLEVQEEEYNA